MNRSILNRQSKTAVPVEHRRNFFHLYMDIAWYGLLSGSAISFMIVYATRLGAAGWQIGLLNAAPAVISLMATLPAGHWLQNHGRISRRVFWTAVGHRLFYVVWIFLPLFLLPQGQILLLALTIFLMSIPGTALAVGFNAMFAATVPQEWRPHVTGIRNGLLAISFIATSLLCGWLLTILPFPFGYQVVFALGAIGALMSSVHLWFIRPLDETHTEPYHGHSLGDHARPGSVRMWLGGMKTAVADWRYLINWRSRRLRQSDKKLDQAYIKILGALFFFHLAQYLAIPLFPLYWINTLRLTDQDIGLGNAVFYLTVLVASTQLSRLTRRWNNYQILLVGIFGMSLYPLLTAVTQNLPLFLMVSAIGGLTWGLVSGCLANYLLERIPERERPSYLAYYHLSLNAAVLIGSLAGPLLAFQVGLVPALIIIGIARFLAALILRQWG
jgi:MFS family permease